MEKFSGFESTTVEEIKYDDSTSTLEVSFHNGNSYQYFDIPAVIWEEFKAAGSQGQYLNQNIKGKFRYSRV